MFVGSVLDVDPMMLVSIGKTIPPGTSAVLLSRLLITDVVESVIITV